MMLRIKASLQNLGKNGVKHPVKTTLGLSAISVALGSAIGACYFYTNETINKKKNKNEDIYNRDFVENIVEAFNE